MRKFTLANGSTVEFTRMGVGYDVRMCAADGSTDATVHMSDDAAHGMMRGANAHAT